MNNILKKMIEIFIIFVIICITGKETKAFNQELTAKIDGSTTAVKKIKLDSFIVKNSKQGETNTDETWTTIDSSNAGKYLNNTLNEMMNAGKTKFLIKNGTYYLNNSIQINKSDVIIKGESKELTKLIQVNEKGDSIGAHHVNNVTVSDLTISNKEKGNSAVSFASISNCSLKDCIIYGSDNCFAIFFSGSDHTPGADMLQKLEENKLDDGNKIENCTVYSKFDGDAIAFCGQKNGTVANNSLTGSRIVMYLCRDSKVTNNEVKDSINNGICYDVPAYDNVISDNHIDGCRAAGIWVVRNIEHPVPDTYRAKNLTISNNTIKNSRYMGISVENLEDSKVINNTIDNTDFDGIYLLRADTIKVIDNKVNNSGYSSMQGKIWKYWNENLNSAIMVDYMVKNCTIDSNILINSENKCVFGIRVQNNNGNTGNTIQNNTIEGKFTELLSVTK